MTLELRFDVAMQPAEVIIWYHLPIGIMVIGHQNIGGHKKVKANRTLKLIMKKVVESVEAKCKKVLVAIIGGCHYFWLPLLLVAIIS